MVTHIRVCVCPCAAVGCSIKQMRVVKGGALIKSNLGGKGSPERQCVCVGGGNSHRSVSQHSLKLTTSSYTPHARLMLWFTSLTDCHCQHVLTHTHSCILVDLDCHADILNFSLINLIHLTSTNSTENAGNAHTNTSDKDVSGKQTVSRGRVLLCNHLTRLSLIGCMIL